jgi:hypothetical protein
VGRAAGRAVRASDIKHLFATETTVTTDVMRINADDNGGFHRRVGAPCNKSISRNLFQQMIVGIGSRVDVAPPYV